MQYTLPKYSPAEVDDAGDILTAPGELFSDVIGEINEEAFAEWDHALSVVNNWRSAHSFPLNTFQVTLKERALRVDPETLIAQRIKRLPAIEAKLRRFKSKNLKLSEMQDIGGCRAVLASVDCVNRLVQVYKDSRFKHKLVHEDDYIHQPKMSGYRGFHLIYRYHSDRKETYNGLKIEVQLRSRFQHYWATAVETVDTFTLQVLKSGRGQRKWRHFFRLMSTVFAGREGTSPAPHTPTSSRELIAELTRCENDLGAMNHLHAFGTAVRYSNSNEQGLQGAHYFLIKLEPQKSRVVLRGFKFNEPDVAANAYEQMERSLNRTAGEDAVLVSVDSIASLSKAYPNYFADTTAFVELLRESIS